MTKVKCGNNEIETLGEILGVGEKSPDFSVCNGNFDLFNLSHDFKDKPVILFVIPSLDTKTCMACLHHFAKINEQRTLNYLVITSDTPFALRRITDALPFEKKFICTDMVLKEFGQAYNTQIASGPLCSFLLRSVFVLDKTHTIQYTDVSKDITLPIDYQKLETAIDKYF